MIADPSVPHESLLRLFMRFLRFGLLAWGGPVAQIAMIRQEIVDEEHWVNSEQFNRVFAVYQVLPGPEAHEMCVYFGMISRGRIGAVIAGLGFMLPGFVLMLLLSWVYVTFGIKGPLVAGLFYGFQPAVSALIVRAIHRIGSHALLNKWHYGIAGIAFIAQLLGVNFLIILLIAGATYALVEQRHYRLAVLASISLMATIVIVHQYFPESSAPAMDGPTAASSQPSSLLLMISGLKAGLLTFGGAYTVIPYLQHDAVVTGGWMTNATFLDGLALSGILPAPLIIFSTFVGYIGGGFAGALVMTAGIFFPAFAFTLIGHDYLERLTQIRMLHVFLEGITAGVVGLIAATSLALLYTALRDVPSLMLFGLGLLILYLWHSRAAVPVVVLGSGLLGALLTAVAK